MICAIYRSSLRDQTYLYLSKKDDFSCVPEALMKGFGKPLLSMVISLEGRERLASADIDKVKQQLIEQGFYLQIPPPVENLLTRHLATESKAS
ncbi:YcgL domain-containing protein [Tatumella ptyseos]|uniref:YcgL domain-containing protein n=1 Tax=Tatumella ptyseos TaxID=82987 RepID=UPI0026F04DF0|nr:YcgL domain-containing protein [Tatumella ptyseos]WKX25300.1 YcgL domain-containing protein [Tatumella ptyseos]